LVELRERRIFFPASEERLVNLIPIYIIVALVVAALVAGWFISPRTRRLVRFAILIILVGSILFGAAALIRKIWFPVPAF
jgi:hypothetical protein